MLIEHRGQRPSVHPTAYVAPTAVLSGAVTVGEGSRIVMENAVIRGTRRHHARIGDDVLVGPRASLSGCTIEDAAFVATGATIFNGAVIGTGAEVRVNGVVHILTSVPAGATVPIGWVAVGDPAEILPPHEHERIWAIQRELDFPKTVFGLDRTSMTEARLRRELARRYSESLAEHLQDRVLTDM